MPLRRAGLGLSCSACVLIGCFITKSQAASQQDLVCKQGLDLFGWAEDAGIGCAQLVIDDDLQPRGVVAKGKISGSTAVVSMPRELALSSIAGEMCPMPDLVPAKLWEISDESVKIGLLLLKELKQGSNSPWFHWIQALPTRFDTLLHWSTEELLQLQMNSTSTEQHFLNQVAKQSDMIHQAYKRLQSTPMVTKLELTHDELVWAVDVTTSRSFAIPTGWLDSLRESVVPILVGSTALLGTLLFSVTSLSQLQISKEVVLSCRGVVGLTMLALFIRGQQEEGISEVALLPITDMLNHNSSLTSKIKVANFGRTLKTVIGPHGFQSGEEVMHSYGAKPNEDFLQYYGFVDTNNVHDTYTVDMLEWLEHNGKVSQEGAQAVTSDAAALHSLRHATLRRGGWSQETLQAIRQALLPQLGKGRAQLAGPTYPTWLTDLVPWLQLQGRRQQDWAELHINKALQQLCFDVLAKKQTKLSDDVSALQELQLSSKGGSEARRLVLALQFRIAKKQLLQSCLWRYEPSPYGVETLS